MPAVTVADQTLLPRLEVSSASIVRPLSRIVTAPQGYEGEGFPVRRAFAGLDLGELDPFVHMDQMGEVEYAPGEPKGTPWHPHRGFETVTYMIDGTFEHGDNHGGGGSITDGDTQWMTAGSGILHIERPPESLVASGGLFHGVQLWVNLPGRLKLTDPRYQDIGRGDVALVTTPDAGALVRVIAGEVGGHQGPGSTHTPMAMVHASVAPGAQLELPWNPAFNALVYVLAGDGTVGPRRQPIHTGQTAVLGAGNLVRLTAGTRQESRHPRLELLVLGGAPIGEPVAWAGPFVMNTRAEVLAAFADYERGGFGQIPAVHGAPADPASPRQV